MEGRVQHKSNAVTFLRTYISAAIVAVGVSTTINTNKVSADVPRYIIPTVQLNEVKEKNNNIYIDGIKFLRYERNNVETGNGSFNKPFLKLAQSVPYANANTYDPMMQSLISYDWTSNIVETINRTFTSNYIYEGRGYYLFQVGINTSQIANEINKNVNSSESVIGLESPKPLTWRAYLTDLNVLYKFTQHSAFCFNDTTQEFVHNQVLYYNLIRGYASTDYNKFYTVAGRTIPVPSINGGVYGQISLINMKFYRIKPIPNLPPKDEFYLINGKKFLFQLESAPGGGDGTRDFPFETNKKSIFYKGPGYYSFSGISTFSVNYPHEAIETYKKINSMAHLEHNIQLLYALHSSKLNNKKIPLFDDIGGIGYKINNKPFLFSVWSELNPNIVLFYQDGTRLHPFLGMYKYSGHYKINNVITPKISSESEYTTYENIIIKNPQLSKFNTGRLLGVNDSQSAATRKEWVMNYILRNHKPPPPELILMEQDDKKIPILKRSQSKILFNRVYKKYIPKIQYHYDRVVNKIKFDKINLSLSSLLRNGSKRLPFIAQQGPRSTNDMPAYYQFGGTDLMTNKPVSWRQLFKYFKVLHINPGKNFELSKLPYMDEPSIYIEKINGYKVYKYNSASTYNFGTITNPYLLIGDNKSRFVAGVPSFYLIKNDNNGNGVVNAEPITTKEELDKFYYAVTGKHISSITIVNY